MRKSALAALTVAAVLAAPAVAQAHVTLNPREVTAGSFTVMNVRVPNGATTPARRRSTSASRTASPPCSTRRSRAGR
jgi:uncharacterized protein YcnI